MLIIVQQKSWVNNQMKKMLGKNEYKKMVERPGIEPLSSGIFTYIDSMYGKLQKLKMVARSGIEPLTQGFSVPCSTN